MPPAAGGEGLRAKCPESVLFSLLCELEATDGDLDPVEGGLKNESGRFLSRKGKAKGRGASGLSTVSNKA